MGKKRMAALACLWALCLAPAAAQAQKFNDFRNEREQLGFPANPTPAPSIPQIKTPEIQSSLPETPQQTTLSNAWGQPKTVAPSPSVPDVSESPGLPLIGPSATSLKSPSDIKKPKISVPNYESKYQAMLNAKAAAVVDRKKQMKLMDRLLEEIANYGIWIVLGLVAFIMVYTLWKEKEIDEKIAAEQENIKQVGAPEKKDIWKEGF